MLPPSCDCPKSREFSEHLQYHRVLQFLMGLSDSYSQARSQILMMPQVPNVNQVYAMVNQDECQRIVAGTSKMMLDYPTPTAMYSKTGDDTSRQKRGHIFCDYCNMKGHTRRECNKLKKCEYCHKTGHMKEKCFQLIGYPTDYKGKRQANMAVAGSLTGSSTGLADPNFAGSQRMQHSSQQMMPQCCHNAVQSRYDPHYCVQHQSHLLPQQFVSSSHIDACAGRNGVANSSVNLTALPSDNVVVPNEHIEVLPSAVAVPVDTGEVRKSTRGSKPPIWHKDYVIKTGSSSCTYSIAMRLVRYVKNAPGLGILMSSGGDNLMKVYCDADWGACVNSRKSITGYVLQYGNSPISWKSKKQATVPRSSAEAEYRAMASAVVEVVWMTSLFKELGVDIKES
uniref:CCHC-type domain-containing protein n=1 Tax=Solanum lycopersicum TaxID=4081 RepID=A0A3Q7I464_SOLLC